MKAVVVEQAGGPEVMKLVDEPTPRPGRGEILIEIAASGVNFLDIYHRSGAYPSKGLIRIGREGAGKVIAVGPEVDPELAGRRVAWSDVPGSYATHAVARADRVVAVPDGVDDETAAAAMLQGMTAEYLTHTTYRLGQFDRCLVHAAAGGVGRLLCQFARALGAGVIGTVSTDAKAEVAKKAGASEVIVTSRADFESEVRRLTQGSGVAVVYDSIGKDTFDKSLGCLRPRGMIVLFGQSSGRVEGFEPQILNAKGSLFLTRPSLVHYTATPAELELRARAVFEAIKKGVLQIAIHQRLPLEAAAEAHRLLASRATTGKLLLVPRLGG